MMVLEPLGTGDDGRSGCGHHSLHYRTTSLLAAGGFPPHQHGANQAVDNMPDEGWARHGPEEAQGELIAQLKRTFGTPDAESFTAHPTFFEPGSGWNGSGGAVGGGAGGWSSGEVVGGVCGWVGGGGGGGSRSGSGFHGDGSSRGSGPGDIGTGGSFLNPPPAAIWPPLPLHPLEGAPPLASLEAAMVGGASTAAATSEGEAEKHQCRGPHSGHKRFRQRREPPSPMSEDVRAKEAAGFGAAGEVGPPSLPEGPLMGQKRHQLYPEPQEGRRRPKRRLGPGDGTNESGGGGGGVNGRDRDGGRGGGRTSGGSESHLNAMTLPSPGRHRSGRNEVLGHSFSFPTFGMSLPPPSLTVDADWRREAARRMEYTARSSVIAAKAISRRRYTPGGDSGYSYGGEGGDGGGDRDDDGGYGDAGDADGGSGSGSDGGCGGGADLRLPHVPWHGTAGSGASATARGASAGARAPSARAAAAVMKGGGDDSDDEWSEEKETRSRGGSGGGGGGQRRGRVAAAASKRRQDAVAVQRSNASSHSHGEAGISGGGGGGGSGRSAQRASPPPPLRGGAAKSSYKCSKCGQLKAQHVCPYAQQLVEVRCAHTQTDVWLRSIEPDPDEGRSTAMDFYRPGDVVLAPHPSAGDDGGGDDGGGGGGRGNAEVDYGAESFGTGDGYGVVGDNYGVGGAGYFRRSGGGGGGVGGDGGHSGGGGGGAVTELTELADRAVASFAGGGGAGMMPLVPHSQLHMVPLTELASIQSPESGSPDLRVRRRQPSVAQSLSLLLSGTSSHPPATSERPRWHLPPSGAVPAIDADF
ncbi:unnamed protein product, partial [Phaeothamnion confervicola]